MTITVDLAIIRDYGQIQETLVAMRAGETLYVIHLARHILHTTRREGMVTAGACKTARVVLPSSPSQLLMSHGSTTAATQLDWRRGPTQLDWRRRPLYVRSRKSRPSRGSATQGWRLTTDRRWTSRGRRGGGDGERERGWGRERKSGSSWYIGVSPGFRDTGGGRDVMSGGGAHKRRRSR